VERAQRHELFRLAWQHLYRADECSVSLGGGQVGVNYEFANGIVIGAEAMFDWLSNSQNAIVTA
jgi:hypothetical protein